MIYEYNTQNLKLEQLSSKFTVMRRLKTSWYENLNFICLCRSVFNDTTIISVRTEQRPSTSTISYNVHNFGWM